MMWFSMMKTMPRTELPEVASGMGGASVKIWMPWEKDMTSDVTDVDDVIHDEVRDLRRT